LLCGDNASDNNQTRPRKVKPPCLPGKRKRGEHASAAHTGVGSQHSDTRGIGADTTALDLRNGREVVVHSANRPVRLDRTCPLRLHRLPLHGGLLVLPLPAASLLCFGQLCLKQQRCPVHFLFWATRFELQARRLLRYFSKPWPV